ncbi:MAG: ATP-binding protein, partial [Pseudomonadota bacterium]
LGAGAAQILSAAALGTDQSDDVQGADDHDEPVLHDAPETEVLDRRDGILNRLPLGLIVSRDRDILFANQSVLDFLGHDTLDVFDDAGGLDRLFVEVIDDEANHDDVLDPLKALVMVADHAPNDKVIPQRARVKLADGSSAEVDVRLQSADWRGEPALLITLVALTELSGGELSDESRISHMLGQSTDVMDIASDGILILDEDGQILHANASAEALFGRDRRDMRTMAVTHLFAEESQKSVFDYLDGLTSNGVASVLNDGREVIGQEMGGGLIPLFVTIGRVNDSRYGDNRHQNAPLFCAVVRDITQWKRAEEELIEARKIAEDANAQKSEFLAKVSHEIRTPLNAIIGFSEVMKEEHFGPMHNERYLEYARDIHLSGKHLVSLVNDLLDLSKIEAGKLEMEFSAVSLNPIIRECVALMQPEANRERIIIRTSLLDYLPPVVADARSIRQIALNLLSNAVKFTEAGGQVIVSTTVEDSGEVAIRVRDTGIGMTEQDLEQAMQPFRQVGAEQSNRAGGTGLGLPLTKALVEANRAQFTIDSRVDYGTLIQILFPNARVLAQ